MKKVSKRYNLGYKVNAARPKAKIRPATPETKIESVANYVARGGSVTTVLKMNYSIFTQRTRPSAGRARSDG